MSPPSRGPERPPGGTKASGLPPQQPQLVRLILGLTGVTYAASGAALILFPTWFLENVGRFAPFNRHYMGDAGAFVLAIGVGIWLIRRDPWAHKGMFLTGLVATQLHALNHLYDGVMGHDNLEHWLRDTLPNVLTGLLYLWAFLRVWRGQASGDR